MRYAGLLMGLCGALVAGCAGGESSPRATAGDAEGSTGAERVEIDEDAIVAEALEFRDRLTPLSEDLERSETHSDAAAVFVWGSESAADDFRSIDPEDPTQSIVFDPGTMFVKEHLDDEGDEVGLTVMYKAPPGYAPETQDWYWARIRGDEVTHSGRVEWCSSCHDAARNTDFVLGFDKSP